MRENADQCNSEYGHFSSSEYPKFHFDTNVSLRRDHLQISLKQIQATFNHQKTYGFLMISRRIEVQ